MNSKVGKVFISLKVSGKIFRSNSNQIFFLIRHSSALLVSFLEKEKEKKKKPLQHLPFSYKSVIGGESQI